MFTTVIASAALMASVAVAQSVGTAIVINACTYPVYVANTPAADGGYDAVTTWLNTTEGTNKYTQTYTQLSNDCGWSIKLSQSEDLSNIMQYEYTYQGNDIIWYDLSDVNGNPWNANWEITASSASGECNPKQQAYRYSTDDAYGMQACPSDSIITVTLCSGESQDDGSAASASSSVAAASSSEATQTSTSSFSTPSSSIPPTSYTEATSTTVESVASATPTSTAVQSTTFATSTTTIVTTPAPGTTVTNYHTAFVTDVVTATWWGHPGKRHEHHARRHNAGRV